MKVCVQGLWHLGVVNSACLASVGHQVIGFDRDSELIHKLALGEAPVYEPGLVELLKKGINKGNLTFSSKPQEALKDVEVLLVTYDTPVDENDNADIDFVFTEITASLDLLPINTKVIVSSQLPVGSIRQLKNYALENLNREDLAFASLPENLRLGQAIRVFLDPDRFVVGVDDEDTKLKVEQLLKPISASIEWMSLESAEMTKHAINSFLATSIAFANEIATICEAVGANAKEVSRGLKSEKRIGPKAYLSPGVAFSGGTLARDINFLDQLSKNHNFSNPLISSVLKSNEQHRYWIRRQLSRKLITLSGKTIGIWGLTYKPNTSTLRRSLAIELCKWLIDSGAILNVHDPMADDLPEDWKQFAKRKRDPLDVLAGASALVIGTEWSEYKEIEGKDFKTMIDQLVIIDPNGFVNQLAQIDGVAYISVGVSA